ncbi:lipoate--protein ligase family protein [Planctomicrobium sp. SH661]|uniref:lipoate--protein ligase family protein n=1 Tax=Planctomicrobium sp. SH661 TaxID=3448124 RepID=UPI003F5C3FF6
MPPHPVCRVLVDPPLAGDLNMAIDEELLNSGLSGVATLRFYQWASPTVSLGHFQARQTLEVPARFQELPAVRRLSGGGAILHDQELTYSCVLPSGNPLCQEPGQIYDLVHAAIISVLERLGVQCRMRGDDAFSDQSFLCFSRGDARDIVIGSAKIVGSAQRRRQGTVLQHGSILLRTSPWAEEFPGIRELTGVDLSAETLTSQLMPEILQRLGLQGVEGELTAEEKGRIDAALESGSR